MKFKIFIATSLAVLKKFEVNLSDFKKIPYVGDATQEDILALGYTDLLS